MTMREFQQLKNRTAAYLSRKPRTISLEVTTHCPLKCKYCSRTKQGSSFKASSLSVEKFPQLKRRLSGFTRIVICGLGESFAYAGLYSMVSQLEQKITVITSGTIAIDYKKLNPNRNLETIMFSLDAPSEDEMIDITGNYNWGNLLQNLKRSRFNRRIFLGLACTLFKSNYHRIPEITRFALTHKLNLLNFNNDLTVEGDGGYKEKAFRLLQEAELMAREKKLLFSSSFAHLSCTTHDIPVPLVKVSGDVYPCCVATGEKNKAGNIFESPFDQIWNSPVYDRFKNGEMCFDGCPMFDDLVLGNHYKRRLNQ